VVARSAAQRAGSGATRSPGRTVRTARRGSASADTTTAFEALVARQAWPSQGATTNRLILSTAASSAPGDSRPGTAQTTVAPGSSSAPELPTEACDATGHTSRHAPGEGGACYG
jgi:hypothetical protein